MLIDSGTYSPRNRSWDYLAAIGNIEVAALATPNYSPN